MLIGLGLFLALLVGCVAWRLLARRYCVPWPHWLSFWLRNPYMLLFCHPDSLIQRLSLRDGDTVLDIGCGAGRVAIPLAKAYPNCRVIGIDIQPGMIAKAKKRANAESVQNIQWILQDIRRLEAGTSTFDRIMIVTVLGEFPDYPKLFPVLKQLLNQDGILSITEVLPDPCYITESSLIDE